MGMRGECSSPRIPISGTMFYWITLTPLTPVFDDHRVHLAALRSAALAAADPAQAVRRWLLPADLAGVEQVYLVALGKAAVGMTLAAAEVAGPRLAAGVA